MGCQEPDAQQASNCVGWCSCLLKMTLAAAIKEIKELQRLLGKKTMEVEILKEAVEWGRSKNLIARSPLLPGDDH